MKTAAAWPYAFDVDERPTLPTWAVATIADLQRQIDRLMTGRGCRACKGSGEEQRGGPAGVYVRSCGGCGGTGVSG